MRSGLTRRYLSGKVIPGSRIIATGIYSTFAPSAKGVSDWHNDTNAN